MTFDLRDLARRIDDAAVAGDSGRLCGLDDECAISLGVVAGATASLIWYYRSNVQAALHDISGSDEWAWRQPHRERQVLYLRHSRMHANHHALSKLVRSQVATNLANVLNSFGRCVEAISLYDEALGLCPNFAMALGNRGLARAEFARHLHDPGHQALIFTAAYDDLKGCRSSDAVWDGYYPSALAAFDAMAAKIENVVDLDRARKLTDLGDHPLGRSRFERAYRKWALDRGLFLNPLNVLGPYPIAATDHFGLPAHRAPLEAKPEFIVWYNRMKQELAAARFLFFESLHRPGRHFADSHLSLVDTLDYPVFGMAAEKMRIAFRTAYGLLDKVAGFTNAYFGLGENPENVSLRNIWQKKKENRIRAEFASRHNWPLRGLYWLAFDVVGKGSIEDDTISPAAADLSRLRNALEHRCLALTETPPTDPYSVIESTTVASFQERTEVLLSLARASLLYLSMAVGREERARADADRGYVVDFALPTYKGPFAY